jgi:hypothetical protein
LTFTVTDTAVAPLVPQSVSATLPVTVTTASHKLFANTNVLPLATSGSINTNITVTGLPGSIAKATLAVTGLRSVDPAR